jgi:hypothetical protein
MWACRPDRTMSCGRSWVARRGEARSRRTCGRSARGLGAGPAVRLTETERSGYVALAGPTSTHGKRSARHAGDVDRRAEFELPGRLPGHARRRRYGPHRLRPAARASRPSSSSPTLPRRPAPGASTPSKDSSTTAPPAPSTTARPSPSPVPALTTWRSSTPSALSASSDARCS